MASARAFARSRARALRCGRMTGILYDDGRIIAVDKPPGLPSTGRDRSDPRSLEHRLARHFGRTVWALHQLDADTSGVILFALRRSLVPVWAERLARHATKRYLAICHGVPSFTETTVDAPIAPTGRRTPPCWRVATGHTGAGRGARAARTRFRLLDAAARHALLEVTLLTGRTHQARLHAAHLGHPLVGERIYREPPCDEHPRHALHAHVIEFDDGREPRRFTAPLPADLRALARRLGLRLPDGA